jgi:hypothetical protein
MAFMVSCTELTKKATSESEAPKLFSIAGPIGSSRRPWLISEHDALVLARHARHAADRETPAVQFVRSISSDCRPATRG